MAVAPSAARRREHSHRPIFAATAAPARSVAAPRPRTARKTPGRVTLRPMAHVLVVDDDPALCATLERVVGGEGHDVQVARDGASALRLFGESTFDLALLDLGLPDTDGLDLVER